MYASRFDYFRPEGVDEAVEVLDSEDGAELMVGGHSLIPLMKQRLAEPDALVDISHLNELKGVEESGNGVTIGALTPHVDVAESNLLQERASVVAEAADSISGGIQVSNRGTIGGNIAHSDPASDMPGALLASNATLYTIGADGERSIDVDDFFVTIYTTALEENEVLTRIEIPDNTEGIGVYEKKTNPASGYAVVGVAVSLTTDDGAVDSIRVATNGALDHATRLTGVEEALTGQSLTQDNIKEASQTVEEDIDTSEVMEDPQTPQAYRHQLLKAYTERALIRAAEQTD